MRSMFKFTLLTASAGCVLMGLSLTGCSHSDQADAPKTEASKAPTTDADVKVVAPTGAPAGGGGGGSSAAKMIPNNIKSR